ncbi:MinD/ParA family ATP-binding protein [Microbacterium immunditiarum]|uniref:Cellulose biosynthesis protein BcsQ n=1 Tax=Microbacterium immunditiarum TaxID=337480 RepID=A0A7Y9GK52_9MICO|nr:ParA family protein [Microbacterium immunditiarum]NYE18015.1 cellulose biosynthesis protein BcsQ [Microbacterium immunditiarum]
MSTIMRTYATVTGPTATFVSADGTSEPIAARAGEDIRTIVMQRAAMEARRTGTDIELVTSGDRGEHRLLVSVEGEFSPIAVPRERPDAATEPLEPREAPESDAAEPPEAETSARASFITAPSTRDRTGWRGFMARLGLTAAASPDVEARRERERIVSRHWAGCRTIAVVNGKGGVGKTMTTAMLAAVYARFGGGNVLAWDNNDTRGTLGWRTESGLYDATLRDLLPAAPTLLSTEAGVSDIARYVHHQPHDRYDVLRSNPELLAADQRIEQAEFDLLMSVAARYYRLVVFDSGNDESAQRWLRMVDSSYQLVIPTLPAPESAESAALLLDALRGRDERSAYLADHAVVVVTQPETGSRREANRIADGFMGDVRAVESIPFDHALKAGPLRFDALRPATQDAWVRVAAEAAAEL